MKKSTKKKLFQGFLLRPYIRKDRQSFPACNGYTYKLINTFEGSFRRDLNNATYYLY